MTSVTVADNFRKSIERFSNNDQGKILRFLMKFMENPASPGLNLESVTNAIDSGMKSARIDRGIRAIVHQSTNQFTLLHVDSHDDAYKWAAKRRVEQHPVTGVLQLVESAESVEPTIKAVPAELPADQSATSYLFEKYSNDYLHSLGVPEDWLPTIRQIANEDQLLLAASKLPGEVGEALLTLSTGQLVTPPKAKASNSADTALAGSRFYVVENAADLISLLSQPIEEWIRFLHPSQRKLVTAKFSGPSKVTGSAGTGKTVVGLHRAHRLSKEGKRVLMTSYVRTLCQNNAKNLNVLRSGIGEKPVDYQGVVCNTVHAEALQIAKQAKPNLKPINADKIPSLIERFQSRGDPSISLGFLESEWNGVIEPQGIYTWDEYRDATRTGRGKPLTIKQRKSCWNVFEAMREAMESAGQVTWSGICRIARQALESGKATSPYDAVIVDEVQDLQVQELLFLKALVANNPGELMLLGDAGQRIYPGGFSLKKLGINTVGRSHSLRINYRTTEQIRQFSDAILPGSVEDLDEGSQDRRSISLLHGPKPTVKAFVNLSDQVAFVVDQIQAVTAEKISPHEIAIFARSANQLKPFEAALASNQISTVALDNDDIAQEVDGIHLGTMHRAKGLEFKIVFVVEADETSVPSQFVLGKMRDQGDYDLALQRERQLLYVAMTRARDELFITYVGNLSPFLKS